MPCAAGSYARLPGLMNQTDAWLMQNFLISVRTNRETVKPSSLCSAVSLLNFLAKQLQPFVIIFGWSRNVSVFIDFQTLDDEFWLLEISYPIHIIPFQPPHSVAVGRSGGSC